MEEGGKPEYGGYWGRVFREAPPACLHEREALVEIADQAGKIKPFGTPDYEGYALP